MKHLEKTKIIQIITKSDFKEAIEYFHFKQRFAKNKEYHTKQVNKLVKAYNLLDLKFTNNISKVIDALILEVFFNFFNQYQNEQIALKKTLMLIKNPDFTIDFYKSCINTKLLSNLENLPENEQLKLLSKYQQYSKKIIKEILKKSKQAIIWN